MLESFIAFNANAVSHFVYMLTNNISFVLLIIAAIGTMVLKLKDEVDSSVREEQNII